MAHTAAYLRPGAAGVLAAVFTVALLGCGAQAPQHAAAAPGFDTSLTATARTFLSTLNASQRADASFPFDDPERL